MVNKTEFRVNGADKFLAVSKALKAAGETGLRKELNKSIRDAAKPLIPKTRAAAKASLPQRGGLAALVAKAPQRVQVRTGQKTAGARIVVGKNRRSAGARAANRGTIRHPVFADGNKTRDQWTWVNQEVDAGWFDETLEAEADSVLPAVEKAIEDMAERIVRKGR